MMRMMAAMAVLAMGSWMSVGAAQDAAATAPAAALGTTGEAAATPGGSAAKSYGKPMKVDINPGQMVTYSGPNKDIQAYFVTPKLPADAAPAEPSTTEGAATGPRMPAVVYIHDIFGMTEFAKSQAEALARQGYAVLMPNLYSRIDNSEKGLDAQQAWIAYEKTPDRQVMMDLVAAIEYLHGEGKPTAEQPIGVVGHDMGGIYAMKLASADLRVKAAVNFYGRVLYSNINAARPTSPVEDLFNLRAPLLSFYGTDDPQVPRDQVRALESRLANNPHRTFYEVVKLPSVGHGFLVPGRQGFNAQAAASSEEKARDFLARYLRPEPKKEEF